MAGARNGSPAEQGMGFGKMALTGFLPDHRSAFWLCSFAFFGAHFGAFLSFFIAVGVSVQVDDFGVVDEAVDE